METRKAVDTDTTTAISRVSRSGRRESGFDNALFMLEGYGRAVERMASSEVWRGLASIEGRWRNFSGASVVGE